MTDVLKRFRDFKNTHLTVACFITAVGSSLLQLRRCRTQMKHIMAVVSSQSDIFKQDWLLSSDVMNMHYFFCPSPAVHFHGLWGSSKYCIQLGWWRSVEGCADLEAHSSGEIQLYSPYWHTNYSPASTSKDLEKLSLVPKVNKLIDSFKLSERGHMRRGKY